MQKDGQWIGFQWSRPTLILEKGASDPDLDAAGKHALAGMALAIFARQALSCRRKEEFLHKDTADKVIAVPDIDEELFGDKAREEVVEAQKKKRKVPQLAS